jgi:hypothetical protein
MPCKTCGLHGHIARTCASKPDTTELCALSNERSHHEAKCSVRKQQIKNTKKLKASKKRDAEKAKKTETSSKEPSTRTVLTRSRSEWILKRTRDLKAMMHRYRIAKMREGERDKHVTCKEWDLMSKCKDFDGKGTVVVLAVLD